MITNTNPSISERDQYFLHKVAHDLRSPLMSLKGLIYLMQLDQEGHKSAYYFDLLEKCIDRMNHKINEIIRQPKDPRKSIIEAICFKRIAQDAILSLQFMEEAKSVEFRVLVEDHEPFFSCQQHLDSIFCNLISNAIRYRDRTKKSFVEIRLAMMENGAEVTFEDNGIGIEVQDQERVFHKFFMVNANSEGTGLGLHIVQDAIQGLTGLLNLKSKPGVGSVFRIFIPNQINEQSV